MKVSKVSLEKIAGGALQEKFSQSFEKVINNLSDPNTSYKEERKITITLKFAQNETRDDVICSLAVVEKLAAHKQTKTSFAIGKNLRTGDISVEEYGKNQISLDDLNVDTETGEIIEEEKEEKAEGNIIDLRKVNFN